MKQPLKGPHHFTGITRDVTTNVDFWCRVMGLRFVKNTLNFETTFRYHTYFGDEEGNPGSVVTFLEFNEAKPGVPGRRRHPPPRPARRVLRLARVLDGPADRQQHALGDAAARPDAAAEPRVLGPGEPRGRADGVRHDRHAADRRRRRHPRRAPHPRVGGRALVHDARGACCRSREHVGFRDDGTRLVLDAERSGRWYFSEPPGRPSGDGRVGVWHHIAFDAGDRRGGPARARRGQRGRPAVDADLRPLLLRLVLLDVSRRADGNLHDGAWISARREARRPRRPPLSLASSGAASRQARSPS